MDEPRRVFHALIEELLSCADPYGVAGGVLAELLGQVDELRQELAQFLDDLVILGKVEKCELPAAGIREIRADLSRMGELRGQLTVLFTQETRQRCGIGAVPILAAALCQAWIWIEFARDWLEQVDQLRIRADAARGRLARQREQDRRSSQRRT